MAVVEVGCVGVPPTLGHPEMDGHSGYHNDLEDTTGIWWAVACEVLHHEALSFVLPTFQMSPGLHLGGKTCL